MIAAPANRWQDWPVFWSAGATVGTPDFLDESRHFAWQSAHGVIEYFFPYPPAAGWFFWPFGQMPEWLGFLTISIFMLALVAVAGLLLARAFGLPRELSLLLAYAWAPLTGSIAIGQNAPLTVVLALWAIDALRRDRPTEVGIAVALLMYKPSLGLPLLGLLVLRSRWRDFSIVLVFLAGGYLASVAAAAGDWAWPAAWLEQLGPWLARDLAGHTDKAVSIPTLLGGVSTIPSWIASACAVVLVALSIPGLVRAPVLEAASAACLVALVAGPRVWGYEAGLALPILGWAIAGGVREPWRTRLICVAVPLGLTWLVSVYTRVSLVAPILAVAYVMWLWRWRAAWPSPNRALGAAWERVGRSALARVRLPQLPGQAPWPSRSSRPAD
jgi:hypothetical protein